MVEQATINQTSAIAPPGLLLAWQRSRSPSGARRMDRYLIDRDAPCILVPSRDKSYPRRRVWGRIRYVHRLAFQDAKGRLLPGETVDHVCFNRHCIQPLHLDACSRAENTRRADQAMRNGRPAAVMPGVSPCIRNHQRWSKDARRCLDCQRDRMRRVRAA